MKPINNKLLRSFHRAVDNREKGLHRVLWDSCFLPKAKGHEEITDVQRQGFALCARSIFVVFQGNGTCKVFIRINISQWKTRLDAFHSPNPHLNPDKSQSGWFCHPQKHLESLGEVSTFAD